MTRPMGSIHKAPDLNTQLLCANFKSFLENLNGGAWGSIKMFCDERQLDIRKVYRQLNGNDDLSPELKAEMKEFEKAHKLG